MNPLKRNQNREGKKAAFSSQCGQLAPELGPHGRPGPLAGQVERVVPPPRCEKIALHSGSAGEEWYFLLVQELALATRPARDLGQIDFPDNVEQRRSLGSQHTHTSAPWPCTCRSQASLAAANAPEPLPLPMPKFLMATAPIAKRHLQTCSTLH
ncbi:hypothetical protein MTP99_009868 [Tenebrio molitor]|jgi:hypothetical protein|nr:hypothetical protein MTP99_009868 [Tenebrio molitor]